ncbi:hypothetical protein SAMN04488115_108173 [Bosea lathyri]|uniref:Uncharacterized protein n=1 Tax=Bosea lathyri TaxID=1036778 RepID=A0A1H6BY71_9HYPH|nr:hypothetical protein SAMN04488115_108173 [Bosea lathyri]
MRFNPKCRKAASFPNRSNRYQASRLFGSKRFFNPSQQAV